MRIALRVLGALALVAALAAASNATIINFTATLAGTNEVPPNASPATGTATLVMDTDANTMTYTVTYSGLVASETAAHIHGFAAAGANAGVRTPLPATAGTKTGTWNYLEADEANIIAGLTYVNIHSSTYPGGEIRGQVLQNDVGVEQKSWSQIQDLYKGN